MSDAHTPTPDFSAEILSLANATQEPERNVPTANQPPQAVPVGPSQNGAKDFIMGNKVLPAHKKLLDQGVHPRNIPHSNYGFWRGCQCVECKTKRNEMVQPAASENTVQKLDPLVLREIFTEDVAAQIINTPNRCGEIFSRIKKLPKEAIEVWDTPAKELEVYGKLGNRLAQIYDLPEFKHKELILLMGYMTLQFSMRATTTLLILKTTQEERQK